MEDYSEDQAHDYAMGLLSDAPFQCADSTCDFTSWDLDDLHQCETCGKRFCPECLTRFREGGFSLCRACCVCATPKCTEHALISCDECGSLACHLHLLKHPTLNVCSRKCAQAAKEVAA